MNQIGLFDLNIEQVLENWELEHAVREIIANASDEQILTNTEKIKIFKEGNKWHIRDFGRGIQYSHFTQNENDEKIKSSNLIGKFGVGLKDALGVFHRKGINIEINSKYSHITTVMYNKNGFNIQTLHAKFDASIDNTMVGTDFIIYDIDDLIIEKAKSMFLSFNDNAKLIETTKYGEVYSTKGSKSVIYINGVQVATEENFLFSYNITNINAQIKKSINRERMNVGRTAYTDTIKKILKQCKSDDVLSSLVNDCYNMIRGKNKDEIGWSDVSSYAIKTLNSQDNVVFMTPEERSQLSNQQIEILKDSGKKLVMIPDNVYDKVCIDVNTFFDVYDDYNDSFKYEFVDYDDLTKEEKEIFNLKSHVIDFLKKHKYRYGSIIKISETIKVDIYGQETSGVYDYSDNTIIIKRNVLKSKHKFVCVLIHEFAHSQGNYDDNTREFEDILSKMLSYAIIDLNSNL